jgi:hypothetical protein
MHYTMPPGFSGASTLSDAGGTELAVAGGRVFIADDAKRMTFDGTTWTTYGTLAEDVSGVWGAGSQFHAVTGSSWLHDGPGGAVLRGTSPGNTSSTLWGTTASDVWAFTRNNTAFQYDGTTWNSRGTAGGYAAGASPTNDVWGVPQLPGNARHWTGSAFADTALPANFDPEDAWAVSPTLAYAAGRISTNNAPALAKWDGSTWTLVTAPTSSSYLTSVWATSASDVWTVSYGSTANIWHWNGTTWTDVGTGNSGTAYASNVRGGGAGIYVVAQGRLNKWSGTGWTVVSAGTGSCPSTPTAAIWVSDAEVWIGGDYGMFGRYVP